MKVLLVKNLAIKSTSYLTRASCSYALERLILVYKSINAESIGLASLLQVIMTSYVMMSSYILSSASDK